MTGTTAWGIPLVILGPLAAAVLAFLRPSVGRSAGGLSAVLVTLGCAQLIQALRLHGAGTHSVGGWDAPLGIVLRADGLSVYMLAVAALVGWAVTLYAPAYFAGAKPTQATSGPTPTRAFWPLWLLLWTALNALFLSTDIFNLYVTLELMSFAAVSLVALSGGPAALTAALRYLLVSLTGSLLYLLGVALVYGTWSTVDLGLLAARAEPGWSGGVALGLMTLGLLTKGAVFPLHFWLPPAHANAPAPVSAVLSALVVKGALVILLRLWLGAFRELATPWLLQGLGVLGAGAIFWGSIQALRQPRLKLLVAYSTVAQIGYLFLLFPLAGAANSVPSAWQGGLLFVGAHACAKTAWFLAAGNILQAAGHDRLRDLDGITHRLPISVFAIALAGMSLVGLPPTSGFAGKWLLLEAGLRQGQWWWVAVILAGSLMAAGYVMRILTHAFAQVAEPLRPCALPRTLEWTALGMGVLAVLLGLVARWPAVWVEMGFASAAVPAGGVSP